jgi:hypothetical protein
MNVLYKAEQNWAQRSVYFHSESFYFSVTERILMAFASKIKLSSGLGKTLGRLNLGLDEIEWSKTFSKRVFKNGK